MRKLPLSWMVLPILPALLVTSVQPSSASELGGKLAGLMHGTPVDVIHPPGTCNQCKKEFCVQHVPVTECVPGKKLVYDVKKRYEYVTIPETRYRFVTRHVTKEIDCPYCMPYCESEDVAHCYESEKWSSHKHGCGDLHCKTCVVKTEKLPCQHCGRKPGETIIKARVKECVKEAYTVYRQVKREICVKKPRYEHVNVEVTRNVCNNCGAGGGGCKHGSDGGACDKCCEE